MKKETDSRVNVRFTPLKEFLILFFVLAAFSGFHMWIYQSFEHTGLFETNEQLGINLLMLYVILSAALVTASIAFVRYRSWTLPIKKLGAAAREITQGNFSARVSPLRRDGKKDFVEVLFDDFNAMAGELAYITGNLQNLVNEKAGKVVALQNAILKMMADFVEFRDNATAGHAERTQNGVKILIDELNARGLFQDTIGTWDLFLILQSAQLHDIGKIAIVDQILRKPGPLTKDEFNEMKKHTSCGLEMIERIEASTGESELLNHAKIFALTHHEKWDGTGYPRGLCGGAIPLEGRIMAIVDVYDALVSERPYKKAFTHEEAVQIILDGKNTQFDPVLIDLFKDISGRFREQDLSV